MKFLSTIALIGIASTSSVSANLSVIKAHETEFAPANNLIKLFTDELASIKNELTSKIAKQDIELAAMKENNEEQGVKLAKQGIELAAVKAELAATKSDLSVGLAATLRSKSQLNGSAENGPFSNPKKNRFRQLRKISKGDEREDHLMNLAYAGEAHKNERALLGFPVNPLKKLSSDLKLKSYYVYEKLDGGETRTIFQSGPIKVDVGCGGGTTVTKPDFCSANSEVCMGLTLNYDKDILVFGTVESDQDMTSLLPNQVLTAGEVYKKEMWDVDEVGNDTSQGAVWMSTGHFIGWDGDSLIGIQRDSELAIVGGNCIIAGVISYVVPAFDESV